MSKQEGDRHNSFFTLRAIPLALTLAFLESVAGCSAPEDSRVPNTPNPVALKTDTPLPIIQGIKELSQKEENTQIAKHFIEVALAADTRKAPDGSYLDGAKSLHEMVLLLHSEVRAQWNYINDSFVSVLNDWNFCKGNALKNPKYTTLNGGDVTVEFEFETPCEGEIKASSAGTAARQKVIRKTIETRLAFDPRIGKHAPIFHFSGERDYIGEPVLATASPRK